MKAITLKGLIMILIPGMVWATDPADTVIIELENDSKVIIYTKDKYELKEIQKYDLNRMVRDLSRKVSSSNSKYLEMENDDDSYKVDTTIVYQDGSKTARIRLGNVELGVDTDDIEDWDDLENEWDRNDDFKRYSYVDRNIDRTKNYFNVELGTNNWLIDGTDFPQDTGEPFAVRPWGSWYVGLSSINKTWIGGPLFLDWGFGVSWYNWKLQDDSYQIVKGEDLIEFVETDPNYDPIKSKLAATYVNFSMVPMLDFARGRKKVDALERGPFRVKRSKRQGFRIGGGGYVGYRLGSRSKYVYKEDGNREKDIDRGDFYLTNLRYGIRAQVGWKGVDFFANYDLNEVFAEGRGPDLNAVSFGIIF
jgi:hypothetical protein